MNDQQRAAMQHGTEALERLINRAERVELTVSHTERQALLEMREALAQPQEPPQVPDVVKRVLRFAGKTRRQVSNPCLTANDCIELADWMVANHRANENCECNYCLNHFTPPVVPQGEWVDLTEDEINCAIHKRWINKSNLHLSDCKIAIEAFKEKNTPPVVPQGEPVGEVLEGGYEVLLYDRLPEKELLYTTPPSVEAAIEATKEKAAKLLEAGVLGHGECAAAIRSLK